MKLKKVTSLQTLKVFKLLLAALFLLSVFKNISYPIFWADESMTAMGADRVLNFGYPKIHDEKNTFYDLNHPDKRLGANEALDAYVGGAGWLQYYYGTIGFLIAEQFDDIYLKTAILRTSFALIGLMGLFILFHFMGKLFSDKHEKEVFWVLALLFSLSSISLALHIREVRYYGLVFFIFYSLMVLYIHFRWMNSSNHYRFIALFTILHLLSIITFSPIYFITLGVAGAAETYFVYDKYRQSTMKEAINFTRPIVVSFALSALLSIPIFTFFKTFEINRSMSEFNGYNLDMYFTNLITALKYFTKFEFLWLAVVLKIGNLLSINKLVAINKKLFQISSFLTVVVVVYLFAISRMHGIMYTRYIIFLQPIISVMLITDAYLLYDLLIKQNKKTYAFGAIGACLIFFLVKTTGNLPLIKGHIYEMTHQYEGPLDPAVKFIQQNFKDPASLVIATNYEETTLMYYLKSKIIIGYVENNLEADLKLKPDIISYRSGWGDENGVFANYIKNNEYFVRRFPVKDLPINSIPEFNYKPNFTHQFKTVVPVDYKEASQLWIHNNLRNQIKY